MSELLTNPTVTAFNPKQPNLDRAINKAVLKAYTYNPAVIWLGGNEFAVQGSDEVTTYPVILTDKPHLTGNEVCSCPAYEDGYSICYHMAAAYIFREKEAQLVSEGLKAKQPFEAALELTLAYQEAMENPTCLRRGCNKPVEDYEVFCIDCALDIAGDYMDINPPF